MKVQKFWTLKFCLSWIQTLDGEAQDDLIDERNDNSDSSYIDELRFLYDEVDDHLRNEDLLGEPDFNSALVSSFEMQLFESFRWL